jgi:hypothetical protein
VLRHYHVDLGPYGSDPKSIGSISMNQFSSNLVDASRNWRLHGRKGLWPDGKMHLKCWAGPGSTPTPRTRLFVRQRLKAVYRKKKHTATWHPVRASMVRQKMWCLQFRCSNNRGSIRKATWDFLTNKISCLRKSCIKCLQFPQVTKNNSPSILFFHSGFFS